MLVSGCLGEGSGDIQLHSDTMEPHQGGTGGWNSRLEQLVIAGRLWFPYKAMTHNLRHVIYGAGDNHIAVFPVKSNTQMIWWRFCLWCLNQKEVVIVGVNVATAVCMLLM